MNRLERFLVLALIAAFVIQTVVFVALAVTAAHWLWNHA